MTDDPAARRPVLKLVRALAAGLPLLLAAQEVLAKEAPRPLSLRAQKAIAMAPAASATAQPAPATDRKTPNVRGLKSKAVLVLDQDSGEILAARNADTVMPVASLTKLMTALVVLEAELPMDEILQIGKDDVDREKNTTSRLQVGTPLTRDEMLLLSLMSSENRAAQALSRHYPGGRPAFLAAMNEKAAELGMTSTHFADAAGLSTRSVSTARDLQKLLAAAHAQPLIRDYSTRLEKTLRVNRRPLKFINSNRLVRKAGGWDIGMQKTGFTNEAGRCLMMQATVEGRRLAMVFLDSVGTLTRYADATRVRRELEREARTSRTPPGASPASS